MEPSESKPKTKEVEGKPVKEIAERAVSLFFAPPIGSEHARNAATVPRKRNCQLLVF